MKEPITSYRIAEINPGNYEWEYHIVNEDNETVEVFREYRAAYDSWKGWLSDAEWAEMEQYWEWQEGMRELRAEELSERMMLACDR